MARSGDKRKEFTMKQAALPLTGEEIALTRELMLDSILDLRDPVSYELIAASLDETSWQVRRIEKWETHGIWEVRMTPDPTCATGVPYPTSRILSSKLRSAGIALQKGSLGIIKRKAALIIHFIWPDDERAGILILHRDGRRQFMPSPPEFPEPAEPEFADCGVLPGS